MKYVVLVEGLKIRNAPSTAGAIVGERSLDEVVIPIETKGDTRYPGAYWARDAKGWSAVQYYSPTMELMRAYV